VITNISYTSPVGDTTVTQQVSVTTLINVGLGSNSLPWDSVTGKPTFGTASSRDVPSAGNATASQVVLGNDSRLSDSRAPLAHNHPISDVTGLQTALNSKFNIPAGDTTQYVTGDGSLATFPVAGQSGTLVRQVRNETGSVLTKGTVVYISGASGNKPLAQRAIANSDATSAQTFGLVQEDIANNQNGCVVVKGDLIGIDTTAYTEGAQLYLSGSIAGSYTTTKPVAPLHLVYVGVVTRSHVTQGQIEVGIQNGYELDEIHDVLITSKSDNQILAYEQSSNLWKNKTVVQVLGYTPYNATNPNGYTANTGTVTSVSVASSNGFSGSVSNPSTTPQLTLGTSLNGLLKGNGTGLVVATPGTDYLVGNQTITFTGDVTGTGSTAVTLSLSNDAVTNTKLANVPTATFKARASAGTGDPEDLTVAQTKALLAYTPGDIGAAPSSHTQVLSTISDVTITASNLNSLDDGVDSTLHFHAADRSRSNHTGTQLSSTISDFNTSVDARLQVRVLFQTGIPYIKAPSGTVATSGVVTLGTALPTTYDMGAWLYLPAGAVSGGLAGLYWTVFSSTTVGQVYVNFIDPAVAFDPATRPSGTLTAAVGSNSAYTGLGTTTTFINVNIPANTVGDHSHIVFSEEFSYNLNANNKQILRRIDSSTFVTSTRTSTGGHDSFTSRIRFRGIKQNPWYYAVSENNSSSTTGYTKIIADFSQQRNFNVQLNVQATDFVVIESLSATLVG